MLIGDRPPPFVLSKDRNGGQEEPLRPIAPMGCFDRELHSKPRIKQRICTPSSKRRTAPSERGGSRLNSDRSHPSGRAQSHLGSVCRHFAMPCCPVGPTPSSSARRVSRSSAYANGYWLALPPAAGAFPTISPASPCFSPRPLRFSSAMPRYRSRATFPRRLFSFGIKICGILLGRDERRRATRSVGGGPRRFGGDRRSPCGKDCRANLQGLIRLWCQKFA